MAVLNPSMNALPSSVLSSSANLSSPSSGGATVGGTHRYRVWKRSPSSSANPRSSNQASKSASSRVRFSTLLSRMGIRCAMVYPMTSMLKVLSILAKVSRASSSTPRPVWMYTLTAVMRAMAKKGRAALLRKRATCGRL